jgi:hypothetical protein
MRPESVAWERAAEVREAAEGWLRAGAIGTATYDAIRNAYPDPCVTPTAVWRILTAAMVSAVVVCVAAALGFAIQPGATGAALLLFMLAAAAFTLTERLEASPRSARRGAAGATAFWGSLFVIVGLWLFLSDGQRVSSERAFDAALLASALVWATGCWRWGHPLFAGLSALSLFVFLSRLSLGRVFWVLTGAALVGLVARRSDDPAWAPSLRRSAQVLLVAGLGAVYGAINVYSLDEQVIEGFLKFTPVRVPPPPSLFVLAAVATAVLPLVILVWAWKSRRMVLLDTGIVLLALSLVTLRHYVHVAPLWVVLTASGAVLIVLEVVVERALRRSPGGERWGFTAEALFSDERRQQILQTVPVVAAFTPAAAITPKEEQGFAGRGGAFGGGGASDKF